MLYEFKFCWVVYIIEKFFFFGWFKYVRNIKNSSGSNLRLNVCEKYGKKKKKKKKKEEKVRYGYNEVVNINIYRIYSNRVFL